MFDGGIPRVPAKTGLAKRKLGADGGTRVTVLYSPTTTDNRNGRAHVQARDPLGALPKRSHTLEQWYSTVHVLRRVHVIHTSEREAHEIEMASPLTRPGSSPTKLVLKAPWIFSEDLDSHCLRSPVDAKRHHGIEIVKDHEGSRLMSELRLAS